MNKEEIVRKIRVMIDNAENNAQWHLDEYAKNEQQHIEGTEVTNIRHEERYHANRNLSDALQDVLTLLGE